MNDFLSPQDREDIIAAGRGPLIGERGDPWSDPPLREPTQCQAMMQLSEEYGATVWTRCREPIAAQVAATDTLSARSFCLAHGVEAQRKGRSVRWHCSVCGKQYRWPSSLDASGRGEECIP